MKITQSFIAKELGISKSTVSRALANDLKINKNTRKKVVKLAKKLNYSPNLLAKTLKKNKSNLIGLIIGDISNPYYPDIVKGIEEESLKHNYNTIFFDTNYLQEIEIKAINLLKSYSVEGIIVITHIGQQSFRLLKSNNIPFILVDIKFEKKFKACSAFIDQEYAGYIATKHLINLGHLKISLLIPPSSEFSSADNFKRGYLKALNEFKIEINQNYIIENKNNFFKVGGYYSTQKLISSNNCSIPTAIICNSDIAAVGAYEAIYESNLKIPQDFSIVGNDDIIFSKYLNPPLTTISQKGYYLGRQCFNLLLDEIENSENKIKILKLLPKIIIRNSTKKI